jgi:hypothetical protein
VLGDLLSKNDASIIMWILNEWNQNLLDMLIRDIPKGSPTFIKKIIESDTKSQLPKNSEDFTLGFTLGTIFMNFTVVIGTSYPKITGKVFAEKDFLEAIQTILKRLDEIRDTISKNSLGEHYFLLAF